MDNTPSKKKVILEKRPKTIGGGNKIKTVRQLILDLSKFPLSAEVKFYYCPFNVAEMELRVIEHDQDMNGNPTFLLEEIK